MVLRGVVWSLEVSDGLKKVSDCFEKDCTVSGMCQIVQIFFHLQSIFHLYRPHTHRMMDILCFLYMESDKLIFLAVPARNTSDQGP